VPISAEDYLKEFTNLTRLLKSKGLVIFKDPDNSTDGSAKEDYERAEL